MHIGQNITCYYFKKDSSNNICKIQQVNEEKDLGVIYDCKMTFGKHISSKVNKATRNLGPIIKTFMNKEMFLQLYKSLVRPHLQNSFAIWSPKFKNDAVSIEKVQRRATRVLSE
jgi:hypothetical protein